jgi:uncharacterized protein YkwD
VKLTRTAAAAALLAASCAPQRRAPTEISSAARIVAPASGRVLAEEYPEPATPAEPVRRAVWEQINRDRAEANLAPVAWDEAAAHVADAFCAAQAAERTRGHFLRDGIPPYARTGLAGVFGYQSENAASWSTTAENFEEAPRSLALSAHRSMMEEKPPEDGHRRAILDPEVTHVGVGWAMIGSRFHMAQEFLARGLARMAIDVDSSGAAARFTGALRPSHRIRFVTVSREPLPAPLTFTEANSRKTYSYARPYEAYVPEGNKQLRVVGLVTEDRLHVDRGGEIRFTFAPYGPGLYTFVFWLVRQGDDQPRPLGSAVVVVEPRT